MVINLDQDLIKDQDKKQNTFESVNALYEGRKLIFFMLPLKEKQGQGLKIAKAGNTSSKTFILCIEQKKLLKKQIAI